MSVPSLVLPSASTFSSTYDHSKMEDKPYVKNLVSQLTDTIIGISEALTAIGGVFSKPQYQKIATDRELNGRMNIWHEELANTATNYRKTLQRLVSDVKYIVGSIPQSEACCDELEKIKNPLDEAGTPGNRYSSNQADEKITDILKVVYPGFIRASQIQTVSQPVAYSSSRIVNPQRNSRTSYSPAPISSSSNQPISPQGARRTSIQLQSRPSVAPQTYTQTSYPSQPLQQSTASSSNAKYYVIDPVTGERKETTGPSSGTPRRSLSPAPLSTSQYQTQTVVHNHHQLPQSHSTSSVKITKQSSSHSIQQSSQAQPIHTSSVHHISSSSTALPQTQVSSLATAAPPEKEPVLSAETQQMLSDAKADFGHPIAEVIQMDQVYSKVDASRFNNLVLYAGDAVGLAQTNSGWLVHEGVLFDNKSCTVKCLSNGNYLVNNFDNWNLILLDPHFKEKGKLSGHGSGAPPSYRKVHTRNGDDDEYVLWLNHPEHLSVVKIINFSSSEIRSFWRLGNSIVTPVACCVSANGQKLIGIGQIGNKHTLHYYDGSDAVSLFNQEDIHDKMDEWSALEIDLEQQAFFIAGGQKSTNTGYIVVYSFDEDVNLIKEKRFPNIGSFSVLRRHIDGDIYFAGAMQKIYVLFYHEKLIHELHVITLPIYSPIRDLSFNSNNQQLHVAFETDKVMWINFDEEEVKSKSQIKPQPSLGYHKRKLGTNNGPPSATHSQRTIKLEPTPYDPIAQSSLSYPQRLKLVKKPPQHFNSFKDFSIQQINLPGGDHQTSLARIQVSPNQKFIYCGRESLKIMERKSPGEQTAPSLGPTSQYVLLNKGGNVRDFADIKLLNSGELIVWEEDSSDLVKYDPSLKETNRLKSAQNGNKNGLKRGKNLKRAEWVTSVYVNAYKTFIWLLDNNSVGLVNTLDFHTDILSNFYRSQQERKFGPFDEDIFPVGAIASNRTKKAFAAYFIDTNRNGVAEDMGFVYMSQAGLARKNQQEVLPAGSFRFII